MSVTSGRIESGVLNYSKFYFKWQLVDTNPASNYSIINWQLKKNNYLCLFFNSLAKSSSE